MADWQQRESLSFLFYELKNPVKTVCMGAKKETWLPKNPEKNPFLKKKEEQRLEFQRKFAILVVFMSLTVIPYRGGKKGKRGRMDKDPFMPDYKQ